MVSQAPTFSRIAQRAIEVIFFATTPILFACGSNEQKSDSSTGGAATNGGSKSQGGNTASGGTSAGLGGATNSGGSTSGGTSGQPGLGGSARAASGGASGATSGGASSGGAAGSSGAASGGVAGANCGNGSGGASSGGTKASGGAAGSAGAPAVGSCSPPADKNAPYAKLSATGCVDSAHPTQFASKVIPYEVNSPLWSDSADKSRGMVLPPGGKISVLDCAANPCSCPQGPADSGRWILPPGTVMIKNFGYDGKLVETRLFEHFEDGTWGGYSYAWDEAQTDATIVPNTRTPIMFNTGTRMVDWTYPDRDDCIKCHLPEAGSTLGPETAQMNRTVNGMNQIDRWQSMGLFQTPPAKPYHAPLVTPYTGQLGSPPADATLDQKARSYLHANCSFCHRPDGSGTTFDCRNDLALADTGMCNVEPKKGDQGVPDAMILAPGMPDLSVLYLRMQTEKPNSGRMPSLASAHADKDGVKLIGDWITSIKSCP